MLSRITLYISIALLLLSIGGGYFFWWPQYQEFTQRKTELERKDEELQQKKEYIASLTILSDKLGEYTEEMAKVDSALPVEPSIPSLFSYFLKSTAQNGVMMDSFSYGGIITESSQQGVQKISFSLSISCSYSACKNYLDVLYKNARFFEVKSLSFSAPSGSGEGGAEGEELFSFSFNVETYAYQEMKSGGTPETEVE